MGGGSSGTRTVVTNPDYSNVGQAVSAAFKYPNYRVTGPGGSVIQGHTPAYQREVQMAMAPYLQSNRFGGSFTDANTPSFGMLAALQSISSLPQLMSMMNMGGGGMGGLGGDIFSSGGGFGGVGGGMGGGIGGLQGGLY